MCFVERVRINNSLVIILTNHLNCINQEGLSVILWIEWIRSIWNEQSTISTNKSTYDLQDLQTYCLFLLSKSIYHLLRWLSHQTHSHSWKWCTKCETSDCTCSKWSTSHSVSIPNHESIGQFSTHHTPFFGFDRFGPLLFTRSGEIALRFLSLRCSGIGVMGCGWTAFLLFWIYETASTSNANSSSRRRIRVSMLDRIVSIALWSSFLTTSYWKQSGSVYCG